MKEKRSAVDSFDDWLPPEERIALRRFVSEKSGHVRQRLQHKVSPTNENTAKQWWQVSEDSDYSESDEGATDASNSENKGVVEWAKCGKIMRCMSTDPIQLSPTGLKSEY